MLAVRAGLVLLILCLWQRHTEADLRQLQLCEARLSKYRKFLLEAILNFEDLCDAHNVQPLQAIFRSSYQPPEQRTDPWTFFRLLMAQFSDTEFTNLVREAVVEHCRTKSQMQLQRDEKRSAVVLGKKQRFHSWGGKRSEALGFSANDQLDGHSGEQTY